MIGRLLPSIDGTRFISLRSIHARWERVTAGEACVGAPSF